MRVFWKVGGNRNMPLENTINAKLKRDDKCWKMNQILANSASLQKSLRCPSYLHLRSTTAMITFALSQDLSNPLNYYFFANLLCFRFAQLLANKRWDFYIYFFNFSKATEAQRNRSVQGCGGVPQSAWQMIYKLILSGLIILTDLTNLTKNDHHKWNQLLSPFNFVKWVPLLESVRTVPSVWNGNCNFHKGQRVSVSWQVVSKKQMVICHHRCLEKMPSGPVVPDLLCTWFKTLHYKHDNSVASL